MHKVAYNPDFKFKEGLYLNFDQVKNDQPVVKSRIITSLDYNSNDFFFRLIENEKIFLFDDYGMKIEIPTKNLWGFSKGGSLFINWNDQFNRIPIIGILCHFVADKTVTINNYDRYYYDYSYSPYMYQPRSTTSTELRQYLLDFESGKVMDYSLETLKVILMRDTQLYDEFNDLSNRKQKQMQFLYLRKYNQRHTLYINVTDK